MARTRNIGVMVDLADPGELLDKEGKPIPTIAHQSSDDAGASEAAVPSEPELPVEPPAPVRYLCDIRTLSRHMDGYEAVRLIDALLELLPVTIEEEKWQALPADLRQHFRRAQ